MWQTRGTSPRALSSSPSPGPVAEAPCRGCCEWGLSSGTGSSGWDARGPGPPTVDRARWTFNVTGGDTEAWQWESGDTSGPGFPRWTPHGSAAPLSSVPGSLTAVAGVRARLGHEQRLS